MSEEHKKKISKALKKYNKTKRGKLDKKRLSERMMGNKLGCFKRDAETRKRMSDSRIGIIFTDEHKHNIGLSLLGKTGPESRPWKGGINIINHGIRNACLSERIEWRDRVFKRDDYTCQLCHNRSGCGHTVRLEAHHIKSVKDIIKEYNLKTDDDARNCEELWNINNGITLCHDCHWFVHRTKPHDHQ